MSGPYRDIINKISLYTTFSFIEKSVAILLPIVLTFYLDPSELGIIANFAILLSIYTILNTMGIHSAVSLEYYRKEYDDFSGYFSTGIINIFICFVVLSMFTLFAAGLIEQYLFIPYNWIIIVPMISLMAAIFSVILGVFQVKQEAWHYGVFSVIKSILYVMISLILLIIFNEGYPSIFWGSLISVVIVSLYLIFIFYNNGTFRLVYNERHSKDILSFGIPMIPHLLGFMLINYSDRIFIGSFVSVEEVGIYHIAYTFGMAISILTIVFSKAWLPFFFKYLKQANASAYRIVNRVNLIFLIIILIISVITYLLTPYFYDYFIDEKYLTGIRYVPWIIASFCFAALYSVLSNFIVYDKKMTVIMLSTLIGTTINLALNYYLIKLYGGTGAAIATLATFVVLSLMMIFYVLQYSPSGMLTMNVKKVHRG